MGEETDLGTGVVALSGGQLVVKVAQGEPVCWVGEVGGWVGWVGWVSGLSTHITETSFIPFLPPTVHEKERLTFCPGT